MALFSGLRRQGPVQAVDALNHGVIRAFVIGGLSVLQQGYHRLFFAIS